MSWLWSWLFVVIGPLLVGPAEVRVLCQETRQNGDVR